MRYEVKLTAQAIGQIEETVQYISKTLLEPETARKWADALQSAVKISSCGGRAVACGRNPQNARAKFSRLLSGGRGEESCVGHGGDLRAERSDFGIARYVAE